MTIRKKQSSEIVIDLTGPDGNAFVLLGYSRRLSQTLGLDWDSLREEMTSGDYENLLSVFDREFGHFVILER